MKRQVAVCAALLLVACNQARNDLTAAAKRVLIDQGGLWADASSYAGVSGVKAKSTSEYDSSFFKQQFNGGTRAYTMTVALNGTTYATDVVMTPFPFDISATDASLIKVLNASEPGLAQDVGSAKITGLGFLLVHEVWPNSSTVSWRYFFRDSSGHWLPCNDKRYTALVNAFLTVHPQPQL